MTLNLRWAVPLLLAAIFLAAGAPLLARLPPAAGTSGARDAVLAWQASRSLGSAAPGLAWAPDLAAGHGAPVFLFHPPAAYLLPGALALAGVPVATAVLLAHLAALALAGGLAFLLGRAISDGTTGLVLATLYVHAPPVLGLVSRTGDLPGAWSAVWPPLVLWASWRLVRGGGPLHAAAAAAGLAGLVLTDTAAAVWLAPLLGLYVLVLAASPEARGRRLDLALVLAVAAGGAATFWLPAWLERRYLWSPVLGDATGGSVTGGWPVWPAAGWLVLGLVALAGALRRSQAAPDRPWGLVSLAAAPVLLLAAWWVEAGSLVALSLPLALLGAAATSSWASGRGPAARLAVPAGLAAVLAGLFLAAGGPPVQAPPAEPWDVPTAFRPRTAAEMPAPRAGALFPAPQGCTLDQVRPAAALHFFDAVCAGKATLRSELLHYPGWTVTVDNRPVEPDLDPRSGTLRIPLEPGAQRVKVRLEHTPLRRAARFLSLAAVVLGAAVWVRPRRR